MNTQKVALFLGYKASQLLFTILCIIIYVLINNTYKRNDKKREVKYAVVISVVVMVGGKSDIFFTAFILSFCFYPTAATIVVIIIISHGEHHIPRMNTKRNEIIQYMSVYVWNKSEILQGIIIKQKGARVCICTYVCIP